MIQCGYVLHAGVVDLSNSAVSDPVLLCITCWCTGFVKLLSVIQCGYVLHAGVVDLSNSALSDPV